ncbi:MAG: response regulator, partial [Gloeomargaritaceae cyanobacterium C42_A2020_066]|nr:response regulator [Gloeomargaritaceae cyanobacterium C42_A2020_066]
TPILLLTAGEAVVGLEIDQVILEQDLVIRPFGPALQPPVYLYGCTILGDGRIVPVVDSTALVQQWLKVPELAAIRTANPRPAALTANPTILVVDDSLTIRQTLGRSLQRGGYQVLQAADGKDALDQLRENPHVAAVFCDVEMPRMNGFEFLTACRQQAEFRHLPVLMLTSRAGQKHRQMALDLGARAYLTKPYLEQDLLRQLRGILGQLE